MYKPFDKYKKILVVDLADRHTIFICARRYTNFAVAWLGWYTYPSSLSWYVCWSDQPYVSRVRFPSPPDTTAKPKITKFNLYIAASNELSITVLVPFSPEFVYL